MTTPPSNNDSVFPKPDYGKGSTRKKEMPEGLWTKCPECSVYIFNKELEAKMMVCKDCGYHFSITAKQRLEHLLDEGSWEECDAAMSPTDVLKFVSTSSYVDQLKKAQKKTGMQEGVISGLGRIEEKRVSVAVMEFNFIGGSMGSVVGEKITRAIERATAQGLPMLTFSASGGARMQEGLFSLMQMAKTSGALARHAAARLPFISILTNPTTGGVTASFATLGDLIISEPKAMIAFAGARVLKQTTRQDLPKGFQTAEFLLERGLVDRIIPRPQMRAELSRLLDYMASGSSARQVARRNGTQGKSATYRNGHVETGGAV